ncbi:MAG: peptidylprolyl isomerase [Flavobacteriaceae bacterium]|nr:peptidylprolyl isomerase [Flavobacteriaceae bacterium]
MSVVLSICFFPFYDLYAEEITKVTEKTVLVSVNGEDITVGNIISFQSRLSDQYQSMEDSVLFDGILKQLIQQTILSQKVNIHSDRIKYALENQTRAFLSTELVGKLSEIEVIESEIESLYVKFSTDIERKKEYNASHILVETETEAEELSLSLKNGADFSELAKTYSTGPSGAQGGNLGWFGQGAMVPTFENAVIKLKIDELSVPVQTQFGWHLIKLNDVRKTPVPTIAEVRKELITEIKKKKIDFEMSKIIDSADVVYSDLEIDPKIIREVSMIND